MMLLVQVLVPGAGLIPSTPAVAADLFTELRTFPGVVLLPPAALAPFDMLEPWRVELNRPMPGSTAPIRGRYLVQYRDQQGGTGSAQIGGTIGRNEMDQTLTALAVRSFTRCPADAVYCTENVAGQDDAAPASEVFRAIKVQDFDAVVEHVVCCGGHYWSLTWYDSVRDMTYALVLVGPVADAFGEGISQENEAAATKVAGIAAGLEPLE
ncbi:MAG: hypothetical protein AB7P40_22795 [Chloroflexota bacterium]